MAFLKIIFIALLMFLLSGFAYFAIMDVPVEQEDVTIVIPTSNIAQ